MATLRNRCYRSRWGLLWIIRFRGSIVSVTLVLVFLQLLRVQFG